MKKYPLSYLSERLSKMAQISEDLADAADVSHQVLTGIAKAIFATAWADQQEEQGNSLSGQEIMDVMPEVPVEAKFKAKEILQDIEQANHKSINELFQDACKADGGECNPEEFGHYLAMQTLGHGVSWFDDHANFPLTVPHDEFHWDGPTMN